MSPVVPGRVELLGASGLLGPGSLETPSPEEARLRPLRVLTYAASTVVAGGASSPLSWAQRPASVRLDTSSFR
jgi:hypothetical protein